VRLRRYYKPEACATKDKDRTNLRDPYLDVEAEKIVATDGHRMVAIPVEVEHGDVSGYIARDFLKLGRKKSPKGEPVHIENRSVLRPFDIEWPPDQDHVGDTFPDWRKVVPAWNEKSPGAVTIGLNAHLLKGISDALGGDGIVALTFMLEQRDSAPFLVRALGGDPEEIGLLMPCRVGEKPPPVIDLPPTEAEKKASEREEAKKAADDILEANGAGEHVRPELDGDAVARKKGGRRG
jgi:hypothetical protein